MLVWDKSDERYFQHGVDRGVLYLSTKTVPWNGITGVDESGNGSLTTYFIDGRIYLSDMEATDFSGKLTAFFWPDEFSTCLGMPEVTDGLYVDNQKPQRFNLSYRSLIGSGLTGDPFGYQIHLIYNAVASIGSKTRKTINNNPDPMEFSFDIACTPVKLHGYRPSAHYVIDTRKMTPETVQGLEEILYGSSDGSVDPHLPTPTELFDLLNFGDNIIVTKYTDGRLQFKGSGSNVVMTSATTFEVHNVNAVDNGDGTYDISDGGDTEVIIL